MAIQFRPAVRSNVGLIIGLAGASGSGKTYSAFRLASGIAGNKPFAVLDTEAGRALHYADKFRFDHADLKPPFRPHAYEEAIKAADEAGYPVIVVDSTSLVWSGDGGVLDWHEEELQRMAGDDWKKREACKMAAWIRPKVAYKHMVTRLLQLRAHIILCLRAEEKIEIVKEDGRTKIVPKEGPGGFKGWLPICDKTLPYELTASFLLTADAPGVPKPIKLQEQHRALFPLDQPITEKSGELIAAWAAGGAAAPPARVQADDVLTTLRAAAANGSAALRVRWEEIGAAARKAHAQYLDELKADAARQDALPPEVTYASVADAMARAANADRLDEAAALIEDVLDERQRDELRSIYRERRDALAA